MKKVLVVVVVLLLVGGGGLYLGWIQLQLSENSYAVIFTKTKGWDETVTEPGGFTWRWERLVPTNLKLHRYQIEPQATRFSYDGELPSANLYAEMILPRPDFGYHVEFSMSFTLRPEALPGLASEERILPDDLPEFYERIFTSMAASAAAVLNDLSRSEEFGTLLATVSPEVESILIERLQAHFTNVDIHRLLPQNLELPDVELYHTARRQFLAIAASRELSVIDQMPETVQTDTRVNQHFSVLERYGEILERFPVLLELITLKEGRMDEILDEIERVGLPIEEPAQTPQ